MTFLKEIEKIRTYTFCIAIFDLILLITPGLFFFFIFFQNLFINLDLIKLVLLSISLNIPFVTINVFLVAANTNLSLLNSNKESELFDIISLSLLLTGYFMFLILFISYLFSFTARNTLFIIIGLESIALILGVTVSMRQYAKEESKKISPRYQKKS